MKILFITTANLSTNPRLVKELIIAEREGYKYDVIAFNIGGAYQKMDDFIRETNNINNVKYLNDNKNSFLKWLLVSVTYKFTHAIFKKSRSLFLQAFSFNKRSFVLLIYFLFRNVKQYDLCVGHNIGAIFPAFYLNWRHGLKYAIDIEDYHPGERILIGDRDTQIKVKENIMKQAIKEASYVSYASPLIKKKTEELVNHADRKGSGVVINNSFFSDEFEYKHFETTTCLRFVWFSQFLSLQRGVGVFLNAISQYELLNYQIVLIGESTVDFEKDIKEFQNLNIQLKKPMRQKDLHKELSNYDIGLAIDLSSDDQNREIALTNKIFSYFQAGLYSIITDTAAQELFLKENKKAGILTNQSVDGFKSSIDQLLRDICQIREDKEERFQCARKIAFEHESSKLQKLWNLV